MGKDSSDAGVLQYISVIIASILPIAQLFFSNLPEGVKAIFISPQYFTGVSIATLILTYILIIAYQTKPYFQIPLPFQSKAKEKYEKYLNDQTSINALRTTYMSDQKAIAISNKIKALKVIHPPRNITADNLLTICVSTIFLSIILFVVLGQVGQGIVVLGIIQSVSYVLVVAASALVLTVYRYTSQNSKRFSNNQKNRTAKAIELATAANCFGDLPQVKYISSYDDSNFLMGHHVRVEFKGQQYEITTDNDGQRLLSVYPLTK